MAWLPHFWFWLTGARDEAGTAYGFWSGFGGSWIVGYIGLTALYLWKHNCHVHRCWRLGLHKVGDTGVITCRRHHPGLAGQGKLTAEVVRALHRPPKTLARPR